MDGGEICGTRSTDEFEAEMPVSDKVRSFVTRQPDDNMKKTTLSANTEMALFFGHLCGLFYLVGSSDYFLKKSPELNLICLNNLDN